MTRLNHKNDLLKRAYEHLVDISLDAGGCDHSVGICQCDLDNLIVEIADELGILRKFEVGDTNG